MATATLTTRNTRRVLRPGWPLFVVFMLFPVWWVLGLGGFVWPVVAVPMAFSLLRRQRVAVPPGFLLWAGFVVWMLASSLQVDSFGRGVGFAYRAVLYLSATVLLLYVFNASPLALETRRVVAMLSVFWIYVVIGGFLGLLFPYFSLTSLAERVMPASILQNDFVKELVHPTFAQVHNFLGAPSPRPSAPFVYTNDWGGAFALLVPFVVLALGMAPSRRLRKALVVAAAASLIPIVFSLNRGLWLSLGVGVAYAALRLALRGSERAIGSLIALSLGLVLALALTPLGGVIEDRLETPHSNNRRVALYEEAISGAWESPLFGYGAPRPSVWNPNAPSVGTQGHVWLVLFSHGLPGLAFFLGWFAYAFWRFRRVGSSLTFWCHVLLLIMFIQLPVYGLLPMQLHIVMLGIALAWRERATGSTVARRRAGQPVLAAEAG